MSERGGVQHSPRVDDAMAAETDELTRGAPHESRAEDGHLTEPLDDENGSVLAGLHDPAVDDEHVEQVARSELARFLRPSALPADATTLRSIAREEGAPEAVLEQLAGLPAGTRFATVAQVWEALGHETEHRAHVASPAERTAPDDEPDLDLTTEAERDEAARGEAERDQWQSDERADQESEREPPSVHEEWSTGEQSSAPGPVRAVAAGALGLTRAVLGTVDSVLASVEDRLRR